MSITDCDPRVLAGLKPEATIPRRCESSERDKPTVRRFEVNLRRVDNPPIACVVFDQFA